MIDLKMCAGDICALALYQADKKFPVREFLKDRMQYKFLQTSTTGLHLDTYVVSSNANHVSERDACV